MKKPDFEFPYNIIYKAGLSKCSEWNNEQEFMKLYYADDSKLKKAFWYIIGGMQENILNITLNYFKDDKTYRTLSEEMGVSVERCRQLINKGIEEFKKPKNIILLLNGISETYEKKIASVSESQFKAGKNKVLIEIYKFLNNENVTVEQFRDYFRNNKSENPFLDMTIEEFGKEFNLSARTCNCIVRTRSYMKKERIPEEMVKLGRLNPPEEDMQWGIKTVRDLASMTEKEVNEIRGLGQNCYRELVAALKSAGIKLRTDN